MKINVTKNIVAAAFIASITNVANAATIVITNPSFEDGITGWTRPGGGYANGPSNYLGSNPDSTTNEVLVGTFGSTSQNPFWYQATPETAAANTKYTLTVDVAHDSAGSSADTVARIQLVGATTSTIFAQTDFDPAALDTWYQASTTFTQGATAGTEAMAVRLILASPSSGGNQWINYDNVRLESVTIPEPSSTLLLGLGAFALIIRRRK